MNLDNFCALFSTLVPWYCLYGPINSYYGFCWSHLILCHHNTDTLNMCMKKYYFGKIILTNLQLCELRQFLYIVFNMSSTVVPIRADQLLPQFLLEPFDTLPPQYRHTGHVHEEILFWKNIFLKICSFVNLDNFCALFSTWFHGSAYTCRSSPTTVFPKAI